MLNDYSSHGAEMRQQDSIARHIWSAKYQYKRRGRSVDRGVEDTWARVATALGAEAASGAGAPFRHQLYEALASYELLPGGRILAGAGTVRDVTLCNTFVMGTMPDTLPGIMERAREAAMTMKMGGGIGFDFSTIRPQGAYVASLDCPAAGPLKVMDIMDATCRLVVTGMGRGAMMATLRCDHPDIEAFVTAKEDPARLRNFNLSVMATDAFMRAVREDKIWELQWEGQVAKRLRARELWGMILRRTYAAAEPGVLFIDRINEQNPLNYMEKIAATNSCAEQPLPPNGACPLASVNLARLIRAPFTSEAHLDIGALRRVARVAVQMLDNAIDASKFALVEQEREAHQKRRIGVGVTGVGNALIMLGLRYGSEPAARQLSAWMQILQNAAYAASAELAASRGAFPLYDGGRHQNQPHIQKLDPDVRQMILRHGLRNGVITTIAPVGTTSMYAGNVSSGIEPVFAKTFTRVITNPDGSKSHKEVEDFALTIHRSIFGNEAPLPEAYVTAMDLTPADHVAMQAAAQEWVDSGISKTVNCPEDISFEAFQSVYFDAYSKGCKGCTTFRPNDVTGSVLSA